jgi:hypothetical protein
VPEIPQPERQLFVAELAAAMDRRRDRIGEYAAELTWRDFAGEIHFALGLQAWTWASSRCSVAFR